MFFRQPVQRAVLDLSELRAAWEEYAYKIKYILFTAHNRTKACMARKVSVRKESHSQTERHQAPHRKNKGQRDILYV